MAAYSFVTVWQVPAPVDEVWRVLSDSERYPEWWPSFVGYRLLTPGVTGVGSRAERVVKGRLPYLFRYRTLVTAFDPPRLAAYSAEGDLQGEGRFVLEPDPEAQHTTVTFYWDVQTTGRLMNLLAPLLKPLFAWNHNAVMAEGERALARKLAGAR
jgi:uncharacterized protein YndB with AHSA1/START domain